MPLSQFVKWPDRAHNDPEAPAFETDRLGFGFWNFSQERPIKGGPMASFHAQTLVNLRWLAIVGQAIMVIVVGFGFGFNIPIWPCLAVIFSSFWLNIMLNLTKSQRVRFKDWEAMLQLGFDTGQLALLLGLCGGLDNPFCLMLIAPATVAAANLPYRHALGVVGLALCLSLILYVWAMPLPWHDQTYLQLPQLYRTGILVALLLGIVFTSGYAWQAALQSARMEQALAATRAILEKEHRLSALGGLAAAAAHELGTPLGTIALVAKEVLRDLKPGTSHYEDMELIISQSKRCRDILKHLSQKPETRDLVHDQMRLGDFMNEVLAPLAQPGKTHHLEILHFEGEAPQEVSQSLTIKRRPEWLHALSAFIENATDFARSEVWVRVHIHKTFVSLLIEDDGPGFSADILSRLGEPYVSSRSMEDEGKKGQSHSGMGLGFFIAKTLCEHTGAVVSFGNRPKGGAYVQARWLRQDIEMLWSSQTPDPSNALNTGSHHDQG